VTILVTLPHWAFDYEDDVEVELELDELKPNESIVGWVDEYGTIKSAVTNEVIGDLVQIKGHECMALVLKDAIQRRLDSQADMC
jgi:hypothetical protein